MSSKIKHIKNITSTEREKYPGILHNWDQVWFLTQENVKHEKGVIVAYEKFGKRVYFDDFYKTIIERKEKLEQINAYK